MSKSVGILRRTLWGSLLVGLLGPLAASAQAPAGKTSQIDGKQSEFVGKGRPDALSPDELKTYHEDRKYVRSLVKPDVPTSLDYSDPRVYRFVVARLKQAGKTPETAPRLFEHINQRRAAGNKPAPTPPAPTPPAPTPPAPTTPAPTPPAPTKTELTTISPPKTELTTTSLSRTELTTASFTRTAFTTPSLITASMMAAVSARARQHIITSTNFITETSPYFEANALVTNPSAANYIYVDSAAWDSNGASLGAMGYAENYGGTIARSAAVGDTTKTSALDYHVDSVAITDTPTGYYETYVYRDTTRKCQFNLSTLTISDPVNKTGGQCIDVCLNRTWTADCDYDMTATQSALKLPLRGSITLNDCTFDATKIAAYKTGTQAPTGDIKLVLGNVGGGCDMSSTTTPLRSFWQSATLSNTNKTLSWNLSGTTAATFDSTCRQVQDEVELNATVDLPMLKGSTSVIRPLTLSNSRNTQAMNYKLACMTVTNACLAEGTKVQLADGRLAPIESIQIGDKIFNPFHPGPKSLTVTDIAKGIEPVPMVRIQDEAGRSLLLTELHPIATVDRGMVQARRLRVGDKVQTQTGISQLVSVTREPFSGKVHNLKVGSSEEALKLGPDQTVVYANGFLVGDGQIQKKYESAEQTGSANVDIRTKLDKSWLQDYVNSATR